MEHTRARGRSFYEEEDSHDGSDTTLNTSLRLSLDDLEFEEDEEQEPRGRARSRSLNETGDSQPDEVADEEDYEPPTRERSRSRTNLSSDRSGVVPVFPGQGGEPPKIRSNSAERKEKSGPLTQHEFSVLRKGLDDATAVKSDDQIREEVEEKIAARDEERERLALAGADSDGDSDSPPEPKTRAAGVLDVIGGRSVATVPLHKPKPAPKPLSKQQKYTLGSENTNMRRFKILLLGDSGVGKSSLIHRWVEEKYSETLLGTVGVNFKTKKVTIEGEVVSVQVWDTAGQEQFHQITTSYYRGAHAIMVVYDISDRKSMDNVEYWVKNIKAHASESVHIGLVGNKIDLRAIQAQQQENEAAEETRNEENLGGGDDGVEGSVRKLKRLNCVDFATGLEVADKAGIPYFETSAKDASGTNEAFVSLARTILGYERMVEDREEGEYNAATARKRGLMMTMGLGWGNAKGGKEKKDDPKEKDKDKDKDREKEKEKEREREREKTKGGTVFGRMLGRKPVEGELASEGGGGEKHVGDASGSGKSEISTASNTDSDELGDAFSRDVAAADSGADVEGKGKKGRKWTFF